MAETLQKPEILIWDNRLKSVFQKAFSKSGLTPGKHGWLTIKGWNNCSSRAGVPLLVVWTIADINRNRIRRLRGLNRATIHLLFQGDLPSRAVADRMAWLDVRNDRRIHFVEATKEEPFAQRLFLALDCEQCENHIIDAWWEEDILVVVSAKEVGFNKLRVPLKKLPVLQGHKRKHLENFELDEDGLFIYWPNLDIHLGWEQFEQAVDMGARLRAQQQSDKFNKAYGSAIRTFRQKSGLRQADIKGLTTRQIRRIEQGECRATHATLCKLAQVHGMTVPNYMDKLSNLLES